MCMFGSNINEQFSRCSEAFGRLSTDLFGRVRSALRSKLSHGRKGRGSIFITDDIQGKNITWYCRIFTFHVEGTPPTQVFHYSAP